MHAVPGVPMFTRNVLPILAVLLLCVAGATADVFEAGDIVVPGNRIVDSWGNAHGCIYRVRAGVVTKVFEFPKLRYPGDMLIDGQGRLVVASLQNAANSNETALFRIDPATGSLERLMRFPYIVAVGDTIPNGLDDVTSFYGFNQSLHLEKSFAIEINDDENGGWPQVSQPENYGFAIGANSSSGGLLKAFRWRNDSDECEVGTDVSLLVPWTGAPYMASDDDFIYYGMNGVVAKTKPTSHLSVHLDGDWGTFDASATVPPKNEILIGQGVFDNTFVPNGFVNCGPTNTDSNVPFSSVGGCCFAVLSMNGLGSIDGSVYATSNSGATGVPYVFALAGRGPYLNPYNCMWMPAMQGNGPVPFVLPDGTWTAARWTSPDAGGILGNEANMVRRVTPAGDHTILATASGDQQLSGRPWRWPGNAKQSVSKATPGAQLLVLRADALVHVLLTDGLGRRLGFDVAGNAVNDFGASGQTLSGAGGWPKLVILRDPELGISSVEVHATGAGDWTVKGYLAHESAGGTVAATAGTAAGSETLARTLYLTDPLGLSWHLSPTDVELPETARVAFVAGPVPSQGKVRFAFRAPDSGARVELAVYDVRGRRVALPITSTLLAGPQSLEWNGHDSDGRILARGVYLARLSVDGELYTQRMVLIR